MKLAPMRYKGYTWPHNPQVYSIAYERTMAVNKVPMGLYHLQDLGRTRRVMQGTGEFVGSDAYAQFGQLANVFYEEGHGLLIHPLWQAADAYFVALQLQQEPRPDYVRYSFTFWEAERMYSGKLTQVPTAGQTDTSVEGIGEARGTVHIVVKGESLWSIANAYGTTVSQLIQCNPQIKNPNLIYPGDEVRLE